MKFLSVCSGIEAASVAWRPLGWQAAAFAEIEKFPSAVLRHHYPDVENRGDMTRFPEWPDAAIDVLVGGTPCQSFSVAGLRKGLADPRGNLALTYLAVLDRYRPRWMVWENVPGALSVDDGRALGAFLGGLSELGYGWAYRSLDAQYFGLAQRRRRVFVVGHLGDWRRAAAVLFERASLSGHPAPRREVGQRLADSLTVGANQCSGTRSDFVEDMAPTIPSRSTAGGGLGTDFDCDGGLIPDVANPLTARMHKGINTTCDEGQTMIAHALRADGFDASEDGTGRGTPIVPISFQTNASFCTAVDADRCPTMQSQKSGGSGMPAVAYGIRSDAARTGEARTPSPDAEGRVRLRDAGFNIYENVAPTIDAGAAHSVAHTMQVRRLTPRECERLQGFLDDYTLIPYNGKPAKDGPRYKALGNSMAVPVMRWIGQRIAMVDSL